MSSKERTEIVEADEREGFLENMLVEVGEHLGKITSKEAACSGHDDRFAGKILRDLTQMLRNLGNIGIEAVLHD